MRRQCLPTGKLSRKASVGKRKTWARAAGLVIQKNREGGNRVDSSHWFREHRRQTSGMTATMGLPEHRSFILFLFSDLKSSQGSHVRDIRSLTSMAQCLGHILEASHLGWAGSRRNVR